jgi:pantothenate synthetase
VAIVDPETLEPVSVIADRAVLLLAVKLAGTRLIDNLVLGDGE